MAKAAAKPRRKKKPPAEATSEPGPYVPEHLYDVVRRWKNRLVLELDRTMEGAVNVEYDGDHIDFLRLSSVPEAAGRALLGLAFDLQILIKGVEELGLLLHDAQRDNEQYARGYHEGMAAAQKMVGDSEVRSLHIYQSSMPERICTLLYGYQLNTLDDVCNRSERELLALEGVGPKTLQAIKAALLSLGLSLRAV